MTPIIHESSNRLYTSPKDRISHYTVGDLPATVDNGHIYTFWQPSEVDIANIIAGMPIRLCVIGKSHPAISLEVTDKVE